MGRLGCFLRASERERSERVSGGNSEKRNEVISSPLTFFALQNELPFILHVVTLISSLQRMQVSEVAVYPPQAAPVEVVA